MRRTQIKNNKMLISGTRQIIPNFNKKTYKMIVGKFAYFAEFFSIKNL